LGRCSRPVGVGMIASEKAGGDGPEGINRLNLKMRAEGRQKRERGGTSNMGIEKKEKERNEKDHPGPR